MAKLKGQYGGGEISYNRRKYRVLLRKGEVLNLPALRAAGGNVEFDIVSGLDTSGSKQKSPQDMARLDKKYLKRPMLS